MNSKISFSSRLVDTGDCGIALKEALEHLKASSSIPIFVYGAGHFAELAYKCIVKPGNIEVAEYVVTDVNSRSEFYFSAGGEAKKVTSFELAAEKYDKFIVIIAAGLGSKMVKEQLSTNPKVADIYLIDFGFAYMFPDKPYFDGEFIKRYEKDLEDIYDSLEDEKSRQTMVAYFNQRITGYTHYMQPTYECDQYYSDMIKLSDGEVFIDCGAYIGDTVEIFMKKAEEVVIDRIYAFEPNSVSFNRLITNVNMAKKSKFEFLPVNKGAWSSTTKLQFSFSGVDGASTNTTAKDNQVIELDVDTIDNVLDGYKATYIKMDIEGAELEALKGAEQTIKKYKPKLGICVYHRHEDLIAIPQFLRALVPEYKFYLRNYVDAYSIETVLYAIV